MKRVLAAWALVAVAWAPARAADGELVRADQRFQQAETEEVPSFRKHVVPLLGKLGCNGRACHGSFQGQGGFRLSLFGYDFGMDHEGLTAGDEPRVDLTLPETSLALLKPTLEMPHRGGKRMDEGSWEYNVFLRWIEAGAKPVAEGHPELERLEVTPSEIVFGAAGETAQLKVVAVWSDGSREDVTPLCRFQSNSTQQADVDATGQVTANEPGDTHVVVFYDNGVVPVPVLRPVSDKVGKSYPVVETPTKVDELVVQKLRKLGIVQSETCTDAEFLRRVSLDLTGSLPTAGQVEAFLADGSPDKRARKIDELLESPAYAAWWATRLCDWTGNNTQFLNNVTPNRGQASNDWYEWIRVRLEENVPYDELVAGIVLGKSRNDGESFEEFCRAMTELGKGEGDPADRQFMPYYWARRNFRQPEERAIGFAYTFLGIRIQCAQCHKHPFDQWTQDDFKEFTGFFAGVQQGTNPESRDEYQALVEKLGLDGKRGGQLRRELARLARKGKVVPYQEVYVNKPRARAARDRKGNLQRARQAIARFKERIARLKKDGKTKEAKEQQERLARLQRRLKQGNRRRRGNVATEARLLGGEKVDLTKFDDPRQPLMDWLRSKDNRLFARAFVNRVWANYFNVGIVEPPDDLSLANPPSNRALLDHLTEGFVDSGFDVKWLHREICSSRTYQLSWKPNDTNRLDERNFSRAVPRRLPAEVAYDALQQATASDEVAAQMHTDVSDRAISIPSAIGNRGRGGNNYALQIFGRSTRESNCDCDRSMEASLLQTVYLQNDAEIYRMIDDRNGWVNQIARRFGKRVESRVAAPQANGRQVARIRQRIAQEEKRLARLRKAGKDEEAKQLARRIARVKERFGLNQKAAKPQPEEKTPEKIAELDSTEVIRQAFLRTLSRMPTEAEIEHSRGYLENADDTIDGLRDLVWALINTKEFIVNH